jgi:hypothetical protein
MSAFGGKRPETRYPISDLNGEIRLEFGDEHGRAHNFGDRCRDAALCITAKIDCRMAEMGQNQ